MMPGEVDEYRPLSRRRRLLIALLAIATATAVVLTLVAPPGGSKGPRPAVGGAVCASGQTSQCVGGKADVIVVSPAPASTASAVGR